MDSVKKSLEDLQREAQEIAEKIERLDDQGMVSFALSKRLEDKQNQINNIKSFLDAATA